MTTKPSLVRDESFVRGLDQGYLECRAMRHAYKVEYFGTIRNAPIWLQRRSRHPGYVLMLAKVCIRCELYSVAYMNNTNGKRVKSGEPFQPYARRSFYPKGYLWSGKKSDLERPATPDYNKEMFDRWNREHPYDRQS